MGDTVNYLKLGLVWPLPEQLIRDFAAKCEKVYVVEELDDFIENHCKALGIPVIGKELFPRCGEFSQKLVRKAPRRRGRRPPSVLGRGHPRAGRPSCAAAVPTGACSMP